MRFSRFRHAALAASLLRFTAAQNSIPSDLRSDFSNELQVSYTGEAEEGFQDGASFNTDQVAKEPVFALGDSDGIAPANTFTIIMIDTTNDNARTLHYVRANFKHSEGVKLDSQTPAMLEYKAPGTLGETGNEAKYTFLLYRNPQRNQVQSMNLPAAGEAFDVKKFQSDNGLNDPNAALGMVVKLDGAAAEPSSSSSSSQRTSASAAPSSTAVTAPSSTTTASSSTTTTTTRAASSNAQSASSSTAAPSSATSTSAASRPSSQASASASASASAPASGPSTSDAAEQPQDQGQTSAARPSSNSAPTAAAPTTVSPSRAPGTSATASELPALQTGNTGAMLSVPGVHCAVLAPVLVLAGLFV